MILSVDVRAGNLSSNDLYLFSETFEGLNLNPDIRAKGEGPVNDLEVEYAELVLDNQLIGINCVDRRFVTKTEHVNRQVFQFSYWCQASRTCILTPELHIHRSPGCEFNIYITVCIL